MKTTKTVGNLRIIVGESFGQTAVMIEFPIMWGEKRDELPKESSSGEEDSEILSCISNDAADDDERDTGDKEVPVTKLLQTLNFIPPHL